MKPWHLQLVGFTAGVVGMCVTLFRLHLAWFFAAAAVLAACSLGGWALERKQRRPDT